MAYGIYVGKISEEILRAQGSVHESRVHWNRMRNVTLSADERLIDQAREVAKSQHKTLNQAFREWLESYARPNDAVEAYDALKKELGYVRAGRKFTREEMNER
jgi:hypothetical protein